MGQGVPQQVCRQYRTGGSSSMPEGWAAMQRDLSRMEKWADRNQWSSIGRTARSCYWWGTTPGIYTHWGSPSSAEKEPGVLAGTKLTVTSSVPWEQRRQQAGPGQQEHEGTLTPAPCPCPIYFTQIPSEDRKTFFFFSLRLTKCNPEIDQKFSEVGGAPISKAHNEAQILNFCGLRSMLAAIIFQIIVFFTCSPKQIASAMVRWLKQWNSYHLQSGPLSYCLNLLPRKNMTFSLYFVYRSV